MAEATDESLTDFLENGPVNAYQLKGIVDTGNAHYLGAIGLSKKFSVFHCMDGFAFSGELSPDSRFVLRNVARGGNSLDVVVALFRQFDRSKYSEVPEDLIAGWVPANQRAQVQTWIDEMNEHIRKIRAAENFVVVPGPE